MITNDKTVEDVQENSHGVLWDIAREFSWRNGKTTKNLSPNSRPQTEVIIPRPSKYEATATSYWLLQVHARSCVFLFLLLLPVAER